MCQDTFRGQVTTTEQEPADQTRSPWSWVELALVEAWFVLRSRYGRHRLGPIWIVGSPLVLAFTYLFLLLVIKGGGSRESAAQLAQLVMLGLGSYLIVRQTATTAVTSVRKSKSLLSIVAIPRILPALVAAVSGFVFGAPIFLMAVGWLVIDGPAGLSSLPWAALLLVIEFVLCVVIGITVSMLGGLVSDAREIIPLIARLGMYLSPVLYRGDEMLERFSGLANVLRVMNPMFPVLNSFQRVLIDGVAPLPADLVLLSVQLLVLSVASYVVSTTAWDTVRLRS